MRAINDGVMPRTRCNSPTLSKGELVGTYFEPAAWYSGRLGAVRMLEVIGIAPVEDRLERALRGFLVETADVLQQSLQQGVGRRG